ncbi:MAG: dienelactone hydrolase family protein [SAR324 cluster bacterium]|nr:dienelactone hydrolase family protein [SAR324 cluster bacterium]
MNNLDYLKYSTKEPAEFVVIWLHGLGASGDDFANFPKSLTWPANAKIRFLFPHAPFKPVSINMMQVMRAWYDIKSPNLSIEPDLVSIEQSCQQIEQMIDDCIKQGIKSENIIVAGFSQGGALTAYLALTTTKKLAGAIVLSGYLISSDKIKTALADKSMPKLKFFIGHGNFDSVVDYQLGKDLASTLENTNHLVSFNSYDQDHGVCPLELRDVADWILARFNI